MTNDDKCEKNIEVSLRKILKDTTTVVDRKTYFELVSRPTVALESIRRTGVSSTGRRRRGTWRTSIAALRTRRRAHCDRPRRVYVLSRGHCAGAAMPRDDFTDVAKSWLGSGRVPDVRTRYRVGTSDRRRTTMWDGCCNTGAWCRRGRSFFCEFSRARTVLLSSSSARCLLFVGRCTFRGARQLRRRTVGAECACAATTAWSGACACARALAI